MSSLFILLFAIALLLGMIIFLKINAFVALTITAIGSGLAAGMSPEATLKSIQDGVGSTLGGLALVLAFGVMLGSILGETGAAQVIAERMVRFFGSRRIVPALAVTGFVVGIALFYNAGFVVLAPIVFSVARASGQPLLPMAIAMAAPLSVTHGFLPPHPGATAVANVFGADLGKTLLLGMLAGIPAVVAAGIFFPGFVKALPTYPPVGLFTEKEAGLADLPGFGRSLLLALLPVLLMAAAAFAGWTLPADNTWHGWLKFFGDPNIALLLAVLLAMLFLGKNRFFNPSHHAIPVKILMEKSGTALGIAAALLLVIAAGGAFKQVLVDSGLGKELAERVQGAPISPLVAGWAVATLLRIAVGSATVAGMTAAGIVQPLLVDKSVSPELLTLAVGAGSLMCSHVNDTGFWMFKEWFGLSVRNTFRSWTAMETIVGVVGLATVLLLDIWF